MREPEDTTRGIATRQCANCGADIGSAKFCSNCGQPAFADAPTEDLGPFPRHQAAAQRAAESVRGVEPAERLTESTDPHGTPLFAAPTQAAGQPLYPPRSGGRGRVALIVAGALVALAGIGVALALTVFSNSSKDSNTAYTERLAIAIAPVLDANRSLSSALAGLHGTHPTAAKQAAAVAERATNTAQGALAAQFAPAGSRQVASEARQALDREATYLTAVSNVLNHPSSPGRSQLQTLAGNVTSAFDAIAAPLSGAAQTLTGADTLTTWAQHVARSSEAPTGSSSTGGSSGGSSNPYAGQRDCGDGLHAGPNTSCDFAQNVRAAWDEAPGVSPTVEVYSPVTGRTYTMSCSPAGSGVTCSGGNGASVSW